MPEASKNEVFYKNSLFREYEDDIDTLSSDDLEEVCSSIMRIRPYPGMIYPDIGDNIKYIIHDTFHSGTINTASKEAGRFLSEMRERKICVFLTGISKGQTYESTKAFEKYGIIPVTDITPISVYLKVWLAHSSHIEPARIINRHLGGDCTQSLPLL